MVSVPPVSVPSALLLSLAFFFLWAKHSPSPPFICSSLSKYLSHSSLFSHVFIRHLMSACHRPYAALGTARYNTTVSKACVWSAASARVWGLTEWKQMSDLSLCLEHSGCSLTVGWIYFGLCLVSSLFLCCSWGGLSTQTATHRRASKTTPWQWPMVYEDKFQTASQQKEESRGKSGTCIMKIPFYHSSKTNRHIYKCERSPHT